MKTNLYLYCLLLALPLVALFSCSRESLPDVDEQADETGIFFDVAMPSLQSRSNNITSTSSLLDNGFHVSAICPEVEDDGALNVVFEERFATKTSETGDKFGLLSNNTDLLSDLCVWPSSSHGKKGTLRFFAFYPSREALRQSAGVESNSQYFGLSNKSTKNGATIKYDYRMEKFKVNPDISRHTDFVTATVEASKRTHATSGVTLNFEHQLSRVIIKAWGNTTNDIEIAGLRIGSAITESSFNFAASPANYVQGDNTANGNWIAPQVRGTVEYIFSEGDQVVKVGKGSHILEAGAASIMGNGGWAMVIPADNTGWNHTTDASNSKKGLYLSILLRVKVNDENKTLVYPYIGDSHLSSSVMTDEMNVVFLAVETATGKVVKRVYRKAAGEYFTDPDFTDPYLTSATEEIRNYGWAAVPLSTVRWKPGYQYTYTLNYSEGVGVHDPLDPYPGKPIISKIMVAVTENKQVWPTVNDFTEGSNEDVTGIITIE